MYGRSLRGELLGLAVVVVGLAIALRWAYDLIKPLLWLLPLVAVGAAVLWVWRYWSGRV